jgi:hypothetical protein
MFQPFLDNLAVVFGLFVIAGKIQYMCIVGKYQN